MKLEDVEELDLSTASPREMRAAWLVLRRITAGGSTSKETTKDRARREIARLTGTTPPAGTADRITKGPPGARAVLGMVRVQKDRLAARLAHGTPVRVTEDEPMKFRAARELIEAGKVLVLFDGVRRVTDGPAPPGPRRMRAVLVLMAHDEPEERI